MIDGFGSDEILEWHRDGYTVSTDPGRIEVEVVARFLAEESYWATGRPPDVIERSIANSLVFGLYEADRQVGFARAVTDMATFAWICDVFVMPDQRGKGLGVWMMECVVAHPALRDLQRLLLGTRDAHELYRRFGFEALPEPGRFMIRRRPPAPKARQDDATT